MTIRILICTVRYARPRTRAHSLDVPRARLGGFFKTVIRTDVHSFRPHIMALRLAVARALALCVLAHIASVSTAANLTAIGPPFADADVSTIEFLHSASAARASATAYAVGAREITAVALSATPSKVTLADISDVGPCEGLFVYESARDGLAAKARVRLGVTCAKTNSFLIYAVSADGKSAKRVHAMIGVNKIAEPRDLVVVNDTLAFIASGFHATVVAARLDPTEKEPPAFVASAYQLSGIDKIQLGPASRQTIRAVSSRTRRVTTLKYTAAGSMQLVGSVKDSRLESASGTCVGVGDSDRWYTFVVSPEVHEGAFSIFNSSTFGAPEYLTAMYAGGYDSEDFDWTPMAHADIKGARDVSVRGPNAYIAAKTIGALVVVDITDYHRPVVREKLQSIDLVGVDAVAASPDGVFVVVATNVTDPNSSSSIVVTSADDTIVAAGAHTSTTGGKRRRLFAST